MELQDFLKRLKNHRRKLSRQQLLTIRGQALSGNVDCAVKGLEKIMKRRRD